MFEKTLALLADNAALQKRATDLMALAAAVKPGSAPNQTLAAREVSIAAAVRQAYVEGANGYATELQKRVAAIQEQAVAEVAQLAQQMKGVQDQIAAQAAGLPPLVAAIEMTAAPA